MNPTRVQRMEETVRGLIETAVAKACNSADEKEGINKLRDMVSELVNYWGLDLHFIDQFDMEVADVLSPEMQQTTEMDAGEFESRMTALLPGIDPEAMKNLLSYANELDQERVCSKDEFFKRTYVEFRLVKQHFEQEFAIKLFDLAKTFTLNPFEVRGEANLLRGGVELEKIGQMAVDGNCDRTEQERQESDDTMEAFEKNRREGIQSHAPEIKM